MNIIASADSNWAIGKDGKLLYSIPQDMKFFRETTSGKVVVMGRKTLESFPGGRPLKNRVNVVLTRSADYEKDGIVKCTDISRLDDILKEYPDDDIFVIGGGEIYKALLPKCKKAYITRIDAAADADSYFPDLDKDGAWRITDKSEQFSDNGISFCFVTYERV